MTQLFTRFVPVTLAPILALCAFLFLTLALRHAPAAAAGPLIQQFAIDFGDEISDGVPAPGAGNIEAPGALDIYTFDGTAGQDAIFDWFAGSNGIIGWVLEAPGAMMLFDGFLRDQRVLLPATGSYTLTLSGNFPTATGTYGFRLLEAPPPQAFAIDFGDAVSDGVPAPGAGNVEAPARWTSTTSMP